MKTQSQGSTHNIPANRLYLQPCFTSTCSILYLSSYVMMSSTITKQPVRMLLIYSTACTLNSTQSKQRSQVNNTYCDLWQLLGRVCLFWAFSPLFFFLFSSPSHNSKIQAGPVLVALVTGRGMCHVTRRGSKSRRWPLLPSMSLVYKDTRHNGCLEEVGVVIWGKAGVKLWLTLLRARALRVRNVPAAGCQDTEITHNKTARHSCTLPRAAAWPVGRDQALRPREVI